jgi:hypothetical protein
MSHESQGVAQMLMVISRSLAIITHDKQVVVDNEWFDDDGNPLQWGTSNSGSAAAYRHTDATGGGGGSGGNNGGTNQKVSNSGKASTTNHSETAGSLIINPTIKVIDGIVTFFKGYLIPKVSGWFTSSVSPCLVDIAWVKVRKNELTEMILLLVVHSVLLPHYSTLK